MVPAHSDATTELFHWQRYLYFRPWYDRVRVVDAGSGEGYGVNFMSHFASQAIGLEIDAEAVEHASSKYRSAQFLNQDAREYDYSQADLVTCFEIIERLEDPIAFLHTLAECPGRIVISTSNRDVHSPGNKLEDRPLNPFKTIEWNRTEFEEVIRDVFGGRTVRFLSQGAQWPGVIRESDDPEALFTIAVIGDGELPNYPKIGLTIPTVNNSQQVEDAIVTMVRYYPGDIEFAVVANGSTGSDLARLRNFANGCPQIVTLIELRENLGYGKGANIGLEALSQKGGFDYFGVCNDDTLVTPTTLLEMVSIALQLKGANQRPGLLGSVSNRVHGRQKVDIGNVVSLDLLHSNCDAYYRTHRSRATSVPLIRGLFFLITPECLQTVGGFDPAFGFGNFEDDDLSLRCHYAGFTNWIAEGAFIFHYGSQTFTALGLDYQATIEENLEIMCRKWGLARKNGYLERVEPFEPDLGSVELYIPLTNHSLYSKAS